MVNDLIQGFGEEKFLNFVNEQFAGELSQREVELKGQGDFAWETARQVGVVKRLPGGSGENRPLVVVCVKLGEGEVLTERSSRIRQFRFAKQVLDEAMATAAPGVEGLLSQGLFAFYDDTGNFRLSLVYGEAEGTKLKWSSAKRLSFYVEAEKPNKTFRDRAALDWCSFAKLKEAFSVEKLTKEFYTRLFGWYQRAMDDGDVVFPNDLVKDKEAGEVKSEQIIRLITRLMFVWFLKQKHLVPGELFEPAALGKILRDFDPGKGESYYRAILQNLFFATLNTEISERAFAIEGSRQENEEHFGVKIFYRYAAEFAVGEEEVVKLFQSIPFMNGGLFECLDRDNLYYDGFSRRKGKQARVPNALFFDDKGLIPLLSQYHFTVEENSPGDEEVALDPEMLGKVFENLLAAYNPETNTQARKATGSFYTPREIVNYMVDESLVAHLCTKCGEEHEEEIRRLFREGKRPTDAALCAAMDAALVKAKILDPACGSGAFPMGILLRMVELLRVLRRIPETDSVYDLKLELIQNCIYGGDIQCIAVQISKLRFFISLVCEQKPTGDAAKNYGIHTLPNLETKFVAADSLIGLPREGKDVLDLCTGEIAELKNELFEVRKRHFSARSFREKKELRREDRALRDRIKKTVKRDAGTDRNKLELLRKQRERVAEPKWVRLAPKAEQTALFDDFAEKGSAEELKIDENAAARKKIDAEIAKEEQKSSLPSTVVDEIAEMLASWDPYDQNASATFSDPEWMFNVTDGFDVVIGNPPYVQIQKMPNRVKTALSKEEYRTFSKTADIYCLFYERGGALINDAGNLCYITSNKFLRSGYGKPLRQLLTQYYFLSKLIDFGELPVFEAGTDPVIVQFVKEKRLSFMAATIKDAAHIPVLREVISESGRQMTPADLPETGWSLSGMAAAVVLEKMRQAGTPLGEYLKGEIYYGIKTGFNEAFILDDGVRAALIKADSKSDEIIKPLAKGDDVRKWHIRDKGRWLILTKIGTDMKRYPAIMAHLKQWEMQLRKRQDKGEKWWELRACAYYDVFDKPKIVFPDIAKESRFTLDFSGFYTTNTTYIIPRSNRTLIAILNSKILWFYAKHKFTPLGDADNGGRLRFFTQFVDQIPIPSALPAQEKQLELIVDRILTAKKTNPSADTSALEAEIDQMVYKLYGLTEEEIAMVEEATAAAAKPSRGKAAKKTATEKKPVRKAQAKLPPSLPGWD